MEVQYITPSQGSNGFGTTRDFIKSYLGKEGITLVNDERDIVFCYNHPPALEKIKGKTKKKVVLYTMFESTKIPESWLEFLDMADVILVPSKFLQEVFLRYGYKTQVVPLGVDFENFPFQEKTKGDVFTFLHYNALNYRKGFWDIDSAFKAEFKEDEPVKMIYKYVYDQPLPNQIKSNKNIEYLHKDMSRKGLAELCGRCDCFVFPSYGEGFGLTPLEAGATGTPVITIDAHGISEYFDDRYFRKVDYDYVRAFYDGREGEDLGCFTRPSVDSIRKEMRRAFNDWKNDSEKYYNEGRLLSEYVRKYTYNNTAKLIKQCLVN